MAVTVTRYNHTLKLLLDGTVPFIASTLKFMLVGAGYTFNAADTAMTNIVANEISGFGWTAGGETLANKAVNTVNTNNANLDADDITVAATGGSISAPQGVIYADGATDYPLWHVDFGGTVTADDGTNFKVVFSADGIQVFKDTGE